MAFRAQFKDGWTVVGSHQPHVRRQTRFPQINGCKETEQNTICHLEIQSISALSGSSYKSELIIYRRRP